MFPELFFGQGKAWIFFEFRPAFLEFYPVGRVGRKNLGIANRGDQVLGELYTLEIGHLFKIGNVLNLHVAILKAVTHGGNGCFRRLLEAKVLKLARLSC